jgi:hypothetical protein
MNPILPVISKASSLKKMLDFYLIILVFYGILYLFGIGCPIKLVTGISCAGCGMVRAWHSLLKLDFNGAFYYHPLFPLPFVVVGFFIFRNKLSKKQVDTAIFIIAALVIAVYVFRLVDPNDSIVGINVNHGLIGQTLNFIKEDLR